MNTTSLPEEGNITPPAPREHYGEINEKIARFQYNAYNDAVGGAAWNGDPLPVANEFFEDPAKQKQANAWRRSVTAMMHYARDLGVIDLDRFPESASIPAATNSGGN